MGYVGDKLAPLFRPEPTAALLPVLAEQGGETMREWVERNTPVEMGTLRRSWKTTDPERTRRRGAPGWMVKVQTEVDYAPHVEWGTGIFGPQGAPYTIKPKRPGGVLSWVDKRTGERVFARSVQHPGSPGQHMMAIGAVMAEDRWPAAVEGHLRAWAIAQEGVYR